MPWRGEPTVILPIRTFKSVFVNAVAGIRRDYAATAVIETVAGGTERPAFDRGCPAEGRASLNGARWIVAKA